LRFFRFFYDIGRIQQSEWLRPANKVDLLAHFDSSKQKSITLKNP